MIRNYLEFSPNDEKANYISETAVVSGNVTLGENTSIWHGAVLRAESAKITLGDYSNVQDNATLHAQVIDIKIGNHVAIGHNAVVHACTIEDNCTIGMGAVVLDNAVIGANSIVGAGCVVSKGTIVPPGSLVLGVPGKVVRALTEDEIKYTTRATESYAVISKNTNNSK